MHFQRQYGRTVAEHGLSAQAIAIACAAQRMQFEERQIFVSVEIFDSRVSRATSSQKQHTT